MNALEVWLISRSWDDVSAVTFDEGLLALTRGEHASAAENRLW